MIKKGEINFLKQESYRIDRKLYKYYANIEFAYDCILNKRIHLESPKYYNDPFDTIYSDRKIGKGQHIKTLNEWIDEIIGFLYNNLYGSRLTGEMITECIRILAVYTDKPEIINEQYNEQEILSKIYSLFSKPKFSTDEFQNIVIDGSIIQRKSQCHISCFSEEWNSILLWSYYAEKHKGVCLEFDLARLEPSDPLNQGILKNIRPVHYSNVRPDFLSKASNESNLSNFIFTKANAWSHEHEWRLIVTDESIDYLPFDCLTGVYLGVECNNSRKESIMNMIKDMQGVSLYQCKMDPHKYEIVANIEYNDYFRSLDYESGTSKSTST